MFTPVFNLQHATGEEVGFIDVVPWGSGKWHSITVLLELGVED